MGRAALLGLLLLAAPALASAQAPGTVLLDDGGPLPNYLNAAGCAGATVDVRWNAALLDAFTGFPAGGVYTLYASNQAPLDDACFSSSNSAIGLVAFPVATLVTPTGLLSEMTVRGSDLVSGYGGAVADCASTAEQAVYLCVQGTIAGASFSFATAAMTVSTARPPPPSLTSLTPADAALDVAWEPGPASPTEPAESEWYVVEAFATGAADPLPHHVSVTPPTGATAYRLDGLVNDVVYVVRARAISRAGNESDPSLALTAMPVAESAVPAWTPQRSTGSGGCASGLAGPLGLAVLLVALAVRPRLR